MSFASGGLRIVSEMLVTVLIVDTDHGFRWLLKRLLETTLTVAAVVETGNSEEGIRLAKELRPTIVLLDIAMLHRDGLEAIRRIKTQQPETRVIVLTRDHEGAYRRLAVQSGADAVLPKEILTQKLLYGIRSSVLKNQLAEASLN